jgi:hypothetical protein
VINQTRAHCGFVFWCVAVGGGVIQFSRWAALADRLFISTKTHLTITMFSRPDLLAWFFSAPPDVEEDMEIGEAFAHHHEDPRVPLKETLSPRSQLVEVDKDIIGYTQASNLLVVKRLIEHKRRLLGEINSENNLRGSVEDVQTKNAGWTLLHIAAWNGSLEIVQYLVQEENCLSLVWVQERSCQMTPLHCACQKGRLPVVQYLLSCLSKEDGNKLLKMQDKFGKEPLYYATPSIKEWINSTHQYT